MQLKIKGTGFTLLRQYVSNKFSPPTYDVSKLLTIHRLGTSKAYLIPREQRNNFTNQLFLGLELVEFAPDTIFISIQKLQKRKIPVRLNGSVNLEKQFLISGPVVFDPDSVEVYGPKSVVDTLSAIFTKRFTIDKVRDSLVRSVLLIHPKRIKVDSKSASMLIPVEPFSESSIQIPIDVVGIADSLRGKTFPSEVTITFRVGLSRFGKIQPADFRAIVDAGPAFSGNRPKRLKVSIERMPTGIYSMDYSPIYVEYLIERKR
jgi:YbbR domain-containing protein